MLRTRGVYMVLATFAFGEVVSGFLLRSTTFGGAMGMVVPQHVELWVLVACAVLATLASFFLMATRLGLAMRSINDDEDATIVLGVNVRAIQVAAFTIGGAFAGLLRRALCAQLRLRRGAVFQCAAVDLRAAVRTDRRHPDRPGPLAGSLFFTILPELFRIGGSWRYLFSAC